MVVVDTAIWPIGVALNFPCPLAHVVVWIKEVAESKRRKQLNVRYEIPGGFSQGYVHVYMMHLWALSSLYLSTRPRQEDLPETVRQTKERMLKSLQQELADKETEKRSKKVAKKYRMVKFFGMYVYVLSSVCGVNFELLCLVQWPKRSLVV